ncbi:hypothetical protein JTB14_002181 [Gonioctena quinquepunctata]|nr:hypothetical protein JTB14_002181 [Gonioctena quinquepunctata]
MTQVSGKVTGNTAVDFNGRQRDFKAVGAWQAIGGVGWMGVDIHSWDMLRVDWDPDSGIGDRAWNTVLAVVDVPFSLCRFRPACPEVCRLLGGRVPQGVALTWSGWSKTNGYIAGGSAP